MAGKNGKVREIWGREFTIVNNGLDEGEVFAFVGSLIDQNNEYAEKLEHLDSLIKLGESTVIEADSEAERIKLQANERVDEEVRAVLTGAEEQARAAAERITAEAEKNAFDRISASEQLAQDMLAMAAENADAEAKRIVDEVMATVQDKLSAAEKMAHDIVQGAKTEARQKVREVKDKAKSDARITRREASQLKERSKKLAQNEIREKLEMAYHELVAVWDSPGTDHIKGNI
jgi:vacuolar-type H+-ATPase subunit H